MKNLSEAELEKWKQKRKKTVIVFTIETLILGFEYSVTFLTLWLYIENMVKPPSPKVYYGAISVAYLLGSLIFSVVIGRIVDTYRCVRMTCLACNFLIIIGNLIYSLPYSPWLLLVGRFIAGAGAPFRAVVSGEIARSYPSEEISSKLSIMGMAFSFGFIVGPGINIAFEKADFWIGTWHIIYENMPGIYMAVFFLCLQLITCLFVHDLSKEYDFKEEQNCNLISQENKVTFTATHQDDSECVVQHVYLNNDYEEDNVGKDQQKSSERIPLVVMSNKKKSVLYIMKKLFGNFDTALILFLAFYTKYLFLTFDLWLPFLVIDTMHWSKTGLNIIMLCAGAVCVVCMFLFTWKPPSEKVLYYLAIFSTGFLIVLILSYVILSYWNKSLTFNILMLAIFCFGLGCLAKMVSSDIQTFSDSVRNSIGNLGALIALSTSALIFDWVLYVGSVYVFFVCVSTILLICRRKNLSNPIVIIF